MWLPRHTARRAAIAARRELRQADRPPASEWCRPRANLRLPVLCARGALVAGRPHDPMATTGAPPVVLIATAAEHSLAPLLGRNEYAVTEVHTGAEVLERAREFAPDAILLEAELPDMSGIDACRLLHADARVAQTVPIDRKSTRLNSSHLVISYAVFCLKKKKIYTVVPRAPGRQIPRPPIIHAPAVASHPLPEPPAHTLDASRTVTSRCVRRTLRDVMLA